MLSDALGCSRMLSDALGCSRMLSDALGCSRMLSDALGCSRMLSDALGCSRMHRGRAEVDDKSLVVELRGPILTAAAEFTPYARARARGGGGTPRLDGAAPKRTRRANKDAGPLFFLLK